MRRFTTDGGVIRKTNLQHITQVQTPLIRRPASAIIVCAGLGARNLGGVEDKKVYPIRGTTVIVRNPEIRFGITMRSEDGTWTCKLQKSGVGRTPSKGDVFCAKYQFLL